jgi:hypothetical protein
VFWLVTRLTLHHFNNKRDPSRQLPPVRCGFSLSDRLYVSGRPSIKFRSSSPTFDSTLILDRSSMSAWIIGDRSSSGRRRTASRSLSVTRVVRSIHTFLAFGKFDQGTKAVDYNHRFLRLEKKESYRMMNPELVHSGRWTSGRVLWAMETSWRIWTVS